MSERVEHPSVECAWCGQVVGIYEPCTFQLASGSAIHATIAVGMSPGDSVGMVLHRGCFELGPDIDY